MKLVRNLAAALVLACALSVSVFAGDQHTPGFVPPPPPPATCSECPADEPITEDGTVAQETAEETDLLVTAVMALLSVF